LRLLLDTNVLLWWALDEDAERSDAGRLIADPANEVLLSVVSLWEVVIKQRVAKLDIALDALLRLAEAQRFTRLGVEDRHLQALVRLPFHHRDPFDHLLIAQAIAEDAAFVTRDRAAARYPIIVVAAG
jgi:PIN domain nuclease of toxin-antitoxin system